MEDYYNEKDIKIYNGDVLKSDLFTEPFIDILITSPPYNLDMKYKASDDKLSYQNYLEFSKIWMKNCYNWANTQCRFLLNIPLDKNKGGLQSMGADLTHIAKAAGWKYQSTIVWNEGNISRRTAWGSWMMASAPYVIAPVELIVVLYKDQWKKTNGSKISDTTKEEFMLWTNGLWTFKGESKKRIGHPAPFPKELPYRCMKLFSYQEATVFDPFMGSGTTLLVAKENKRKAIGVDIAKEYCELAKLRLISET